MFIFSLGLYRHTDMRDTRGREWFLCRIRHPRYGKYRTTAFHALNYHNSNYSYVIPVYLLNDILISIHEVLPFLLDDPYVSRIVYYEDSYLKTKTQFSSC